MDEKDWDDPDLTMMEKFGKTCFWQHLGSSHSPSSSTAREVGTWEDEDIRKIEAIQFLGWTRKSNKVITEKCFSPLHTGWSYPPVWWNCQAFATRLAFFVVELETFQDLAARLAKQLHEHIVGWVISRREEKLLKGIDIGFEGIWGSGAGVLVLGYIFPPSGVVFLAGFIGSWSLSFGSILTGVIYGGIDAARHKKFRENMERLEDDFPSLKRFHAYIRDENH